MKRSILLLILPSLLWAQWLEQTDWSGGPGVTGPEWWFGDTFLESFSMDWSGIPGQLALQVWKDLPAVDDAYCSGMLVSSMGLVPMGTDWNIEWGDIIWTCYEPDSTEVYFLLRTGNSPGTMGEWSEPITESGTYLGSLLPDDILIVQYMIILETTDLDSLPRIYDVIIEGWYPGGIEEGTHPVAPGAVLRTGANPSTGTISGHLSLNAPEEVVLRVYDTSGRFVTELFDESLSAGEHAFRHGMSVPGVYWLVLETGGGTGMERLTVINP